jgi:hypothetical protein
MRLSFLLLVCCGVATSLPAQDDSGGRNRMTFPSGSGQPVITKDPAPQPSATPVLSEGPVDQPQKVIDLFFNSLKADKVDAAYDALIKGTIIGEKPEDVNALKGRTRQALDSYGPIYGWEVVDEQVVGSSLLRRTIVSQNSDLPLRWRFYFYKSGGQWRLVDLRVDDALVELFEEAGRKRK